MKTQTNLLSFVFCLIFALSGCGGKSDKPTSSTNNTSLKNSILQLEDTLLINQGVDLILYFPDDKLTNINWVQESGNPIPLLATTSKGIGFTPVTAGEYSFTASFQRNGGSTESITKSVNILEQTSLLTTRLAHAVLSGNKVSLRVQLDSSIANDAIIWKQVAGPAIALTADELTGSNAIFFEAPHVDKDTYISFEASAVHEEFTYTDKVTIIVESAPAINNNAYFEDRVAKVFPYNKTSPYSEKLTNCVYSNTLTSSCTLSTLPLIAKEVQSTNNTPTLTTIMDRLVVSHHWMGDRFKEFLLNSDPHNDFKNLLRATTAIVISYDIRPSFYWAATGAIYLDANNFWLTAHERDTINEAPDYRSCFGSELQFSMPWRYVKDNNYASDFIPTSVRTDRVASQRVHRLTSLMYHELAHANDFFPSNEWYTHSTNSRILDAALSTNFESDQLAVAIPLQSQTMRDLAQVSFAGNQASETHKNFRPSDVESFFEPDAATDFYAYSSLREDYAMLFEELMMQNRFNVFRDVAITNKPTGTDISGSDYIVTWGQRGRIGEEKIKQRTLFSASRILPEFDSVSALQNISAPINMEQGKNWIESLTISPTQPNSQKEARTSNSSLLKPVQYQYYHKVLPTH